MYFIDFTGVEKAPEHFRPALHKKVCHPTSAQLVEERGHGRSSRFCGETEHLTAEPFQRLLA